MRRLARWTLNALTALSLVLFLAATAAWARCPWRSDYLWCYLRHQSLSIISDRQRLRLTLVASPENVPPEMNFRTCAAGELHFSMEHTSDADLMIPRSEHRSVVCESGVRWEHEHGFADDEDLRLPALPWPQYRYYSVRVAPWALAALAAILPASRAARWARRARIAVSGHCPACSYDLTGNVSGVCPECGTAIVKGTT